jgi:hypothetical protein
MAKRKRSEADTTQSSCETSLLALLVHAADDVMSSEQHVSLARAPASPLVKPRLPSSMNLPLPKQPFTMDCNKNVYRELSQRTARSGTMTSPLLIHHVNYAKSTSMSHRTFKQAMQFRTTQRKPNIGRPSSAHPILLTRVSPGEIRGSQCKNNQ